MKIVVCIGSSCHLKGSRQVVEELQYLIKNRKIDADVELSGAFCMNKCGEDGVSVTVDKKEYRVLPNKINEFFDDVIIKGINNKA